MPSRTPCIRARRPGKAGHARKDSTRHANRRARLDAAVPRLGGGGQPISGLPEIGILSAQVGYCGLAVQLCRGRSLAPQLPAPFHLGGRDFGRPGPLPERQQHGAVAARAHPARGREGAARSALSRPSHFFAHDLDRKPVPIPDQVEDMLFGIMRYCGTTSPRPTLTRLASSEPSGFFSARTMAICAPGLSSALSPIT